MIQAIKGRSKAVPWKVMAFRLSGGDFPTYMRIMRMATLGEVLEFVEMASLAELFSDKRRRGKKRWRTR